MSRVNPVMETMHRIRVKLYPGYLPGIKGKYIARTDPEALLTNEEVCAFLINRGGYTGSYEDLVMAVKQFFDEMVYQLCNGFAVNTGYFSIHPSVGGTFTSVTDTLDEKHPVGFNFRVRPRLRGLVKYIELEITGIADASGYIDEFMDVEEESINTLYAPGGQFIIHGNGIKVAGSNPACGVRFVPVDDPSKAVKVEHLAENHPTTIIGLSPRTGFRLNRIEICSQYEGSTTKFLKGIRTMTSDFILEEIGS